MITYYFKKTNKQNIISTKLSYKINQNIVIQIQQKKIKEKQLDIFHPHQLGRPTYGCG